MSAQESGSWSNLADSEGQESFEEGGEDGGLNLQFALRD